MGYWIFVAGQLVAGLAVLLVVLRARRARREARQREADLAALAELGHLANYRLACQLYGQDAVDRSIREAHRRGAN